MEQNRSDQRTTFELVDYVEVFRRSRWLIALTTLIATAFGIGLPLITPSTYRSEALVIIEPVPALGNSALAGATAGDLPTLVELADTSTVEDLVVRRLGETVDPDRLEISQPTDQLLRLSYVSTESAKAERAVQAYAEAVIELRSRFLSERLTRVRSIIEDRVTELSAQIDATSDDTLRVARVLELDALRNSLEDVHPGLVELGSGYIASESTDPRLASTTPLKGGLSGMAIGLAIGVLVAFVGEFARRVGTRGTPA